VSKREVYKYINSFLKLEKNWDGYGASKFDKEIISYTKYLIKNFIPKKIRKKLTEDDICPNPNGTVSIIMEYNKKEDFECWEVGIRHATHTICQSGILIKSEYLYYR
jgi:hypothetical protein